MAAFCGQCGARALPEARHCTSCGARLSATEPDELVAVEAPWDPQVLGRYQPLHQLGRGVRGAVWLAHDTVLRRPVAVKIVDLPDDAALEAMTGQLRAAAAVQHPHAVAVYDLVRTVGLGGGPRMLIVRQYVEGAPLSRLVAEGGPLSPGAAARLLVGPAEALAAAHRAGVGHRALSTDAVLVDRSGSAKLADLGLGQGGGAAADVRAFGVVLYAALGRPAPVPGSVPASAELADTGSLAPLLQRMAAAPDAELPEAAALVRALAAAAAREPGAPLVLPPPDPAKPAAGAPSTSPPPVPAVSAPVASAPAGPAPVTSAPAGAAPTASAPAAAAPVASAPVGPAASVVTVAPRSGARPVLVVAGAVAVLAVALGGWRLLSGGSTSAPPPGSPVVTVTQSTARGGGSASGQRPPATSNGSASSLPTGPSSFAAPSQGSGTIDVVSGSPGTACGPAGAVGWGAYPMGDCAFWQSATGLTTGLPLSKTDHKGIACQADLRHPNPIYKATQTNTWWVWTQANDGTWDWFPQTAISQGAAGLPINGIARCQIQP